MLKLQEFLKKHNWTEYESKAYCTIVENGPMKANDLAIKAGIPAGRIYEVITRLRDKGWLKRTQSRPAIYDAQNPRTVLDVEVDQLQMEMKEPLEKAEEAWEVRQGRIGGADDKSWTVSGIYGIILEFRGLCNSVEKSIKIIDSSLQWLSNRDLERLVKLTKNKVKVSIASTDRHKDQLNRLASIGVKTYVLEKIDVSFYIFDDETVMIKFVSPDNGTVIKDRNMGEIFISKFDEVIKGAKMIKVEEIAS